MFRLYMDHYYGEVTVTVTRESYLNKMQVVHIENYMPIKFKILKGVIYLGLRIFAIKSNFFQTSTKPSSM